MADPDAFADLDALAAQGEDGTLWRVAHVWSYPGVPGPDANAANLRPPLPNLPDARVKASLAAGAWVPTHLDMHGAAQGVIKAPADGSRPVPKGATSFGAIDCPHD